MTISRGRAGTGLVTMPAVRKWFLGGRPHARPWLQWLDTPLFRIAAIALVVLEIAGAHVAWLKWTVAALFVVSLIAGVASSLILRKQK